MQGMLKRRCLDAGLTTQGRGPQLSATTKLAGKGMVGGVGRGRIHRGRGSCPATMLYVYTNGADQCRAGRGKPIDPTRVLGRWASNETPWTPQEHSHEITRRAKASGRGDTCFDRCLRLDRLTPLRWPDRPGLR